MDHRDEGEAMSNVYTPADRVVVHFGSPPDERYGVRDEKVIDDFVARNPQFTIPGRDEE